MRRAVLGLLAGLLAGEPAIAAPPPPSPAGWIVARGDQPTFCAATGPADGEALLSIGAAGPQLLLMVYSPALARPQASYPMTLSIDGGTPLQMSALGQDSTYGAPISSSLAKALGPAARLDLTASGHRFTFKVRNVGPALDAVARCAGGPTPAERDAHPARPIAGAGGWLLEAPMPGTSQCAARLPGNEVDLSLALNREGKLLLMAARPARGPTPAARPSAAACLRG